MIKWFGIRNTYIKDNKTSYTRRLEKQASVPEPRDLKQLQKTVLR